MTVTVDSLISRVVFAAANQARIGSHYLKGGYGQIFDHERNLVAGSAVPGHAGRRWGHMAPPHLSSQDKPICFAPESDRPGIGPRVCAGRCHHPSVQGRQVASQIRGATPEQVVAFANSCRNPQHFLWPRPADDEHSTNVVNGECCIRVRHFDCIGFVNWCFWVALNGTRAVAYRVEDWHNENQSGTQLLPRAQAQPGDILFGYGGSIGEHIGIVVSPTEVVHSAGWSVGVIQEPIANRTWNAQMARPRRFLAIKLRGLGPEAQARIESDTASGAFRR